MLMMLGGLVVIYLSFRVVLSSDIEVMIDGVKDLEFIDLVERG